MKEHSVEPNEQQNPASTVPDMESVSAQFFFADRLIDYNGHVAPEDFTLPEDMDIIPWDHPRFFWLTIRGRLVAGPARREVLESFAHDLCTNPKIGKRQAGIRNIIEDNNLG